MPNEYWLTYLQNDILCIVVGWIFTVLLPWKHIVNVQDHPRSPLFLTFWFMLCKHLLSTINHLVLQSIGSILVLGMSCINTNLLTRNILGWNSDFGHMCVVTLMRLCLTIYRSVFTLPCVIKHSIFWVTFDINQMNSKIFSFKIMYYSLL